MVERGVGAHLAISSAVKDSLVQNGVEAQKILLLHNWINTRMTKPLHGTVAPLAADDIFSLVSIGRIIPWKGQHLLVALGRALKERGIAFQIQVFGDAPSADDQYLRQLKEATAEHGLQQEILFLGYQDYAAIYRRPLHALVHTSIAPEPFGRVIIEAMYNHIPILATRSGGVLDIVEDGLNGLLFDPLNAQELLAKTIRLHKEPKLRAHLAENAYQTVLRKFSEQGKMGLMADLYDRLVMPARQERPRMAERL
jgi:glycosyltransferase involved in cell wall biosynthesis